MNNIHIDYGGSNQQLNYTPTTEVRSRPPSGSRGPRHDTAHHFSQANVPRNQRPEQAPGIIELSDSQHNFLASFGDKYLADIRKEPGIDLSLIHI